MNQRGAMKSSLSLRIMAVCVLLVMVTSPVIAKEPLHPAVHNSIDLDNGIIGLVEFGETASEEWYYDSYDHINWEEAAISAGGNAPVYLSSGEVDTDFPDSGVADVWYDSVTYLDLDGDASNDVRVSRSVKLPSSSSYFLVRYRLENTKGITLTDVRLFQGVDYDVAEEDENDAEHESTGDFVWAVESSTGKYVGFKGSVASSRHDAAYYADVWGNINSGALSNQGEDDNDDVGLALQWNLGDLTPGCSAEVTLKFGFADSYTELESQMNTFTQTPLPSCSGTTAIPEYPTVAIPMIAVFSIVSVFLRRRGGKKQ